MVDGQLVWIGAEGREEKGKESERPEGKMGDLRESEQGQRTKDKDSCYFLMSRLIMSHIYQQRTLESERIKWEAHDTVRSPAGLIFINHYSQLIFKNPLPSIL